MTNDTNAAIAAFNKFNDILEKNIKSKSKLKGFSDISEYIPTGNYMLNALMSGSIFGGYPNTRSIGIAGESGTGKTFLCLNATRECQDMGYLTYYIDTEGALDSTDFANFGVDLKRLKYLRIGIISELKFFMNDLIKTAEANPGLKIMVVIDSTTQMETEKQSNDADTGKNASDMGLTAKELRALFKSFVLDLSNLKIPCLFTSHIYVGTGMFAGKSISGGGGPIYAASVILMLGKSALKETGEDGKEARTGVICRASTYKNRLASPDEIELHISFHKGMNRFVGLHLLPFTFDNCGVGRGNKFTDKQFTKLSPADQKLCSEFKVNGETFYFLAKDKAHNFILKETGESVPFRDLFTSKVWTPTVLKQLDENVVKPKYKYSTVQDIIDEESNDFELLKNSESDDEGTSI